jgi:enoyl-CoA hydratase/carnithine racemase
MTATPSESPPSESPPSDRLVLAEDVGAVRTITFNRPTRLNAFTAASYARLSTLLREAAVDDDVRVVLLRGEGRAFSSGVDLEELSGGDEGNLALRDNFDQLIAVLVDHPKPLIAAVHGPAVGFGATMLLHCDLVLVADDARLRFPFTSLRTAPEAGSSALLPAAVGPQRAAELLFTSRWIGAEEAVDIGLALACYPREQLQGQARGLAERIAQQPAAAVESVKRLLRTERAEMVRDASARERAEAQRLGVALGSFGSSPVPE